MDVVAAVTAAVAVVGATAEGLAVVVCTAAAGPQPQHALE